MSDAALKLNARVWFEQGDNSLAGHTEVALLQAIADSGSISAAAKQLGRSYKWAWDTLETMNRLSDSPLVTRETGGKHGGGTRLTPRGEQLVAAYQAIARAHAAFVAALSEEAGTLEQSLPLLKRLALKTSARNQLFGRVSRIASGPVNDLVTLTLGGGDTLDVVVTHLSSEQLGIRPGIELVALIKAQWVGIQPAAGAEIPEGNRLAGTVQSVVAGTEQAEVCLQLAGGDTLFGIVPPEQAHRLPPGSAALAVFDARSVILGAPF